jgi:hypothetical protein
MEWAELAPDLAACRSEGFGNHRVLIRGDVGTSRGSQIKDAGHIAFLLRAGEIVRYEAPDVFSEGNTQFGRASASLSLQLGFEGDLGPHHHDGTIMPWSMGH